MCRTALLIPTLWLIVGGAAHAADATTNGSDLAASGRILFEQKCAACHSIGGGIRVGPDLHGVTERRPEEWLLRFIVAPEQLIAANDPIATALVQRFNQIVMPSLGLTDGEARALLAHLRSVSASVPAMAPEPVQAPMPSPVLAPMQSRILVLFLGLAAVIAAVFAWIGLSTRSPADVDVHRAYLIRRVFFAAAIAAAVALLVVTIPLAPYAAGAADVDRVVYVAARQFDFVFSDEPITSAEDLGRVPRIDRLEIPAGTLVEFRVTSLDVNHGFGLYGPQRQIIAQTQAMPGYFNRLRVRLTEPAQYRVFCLEYCAAGHHLMQTRLTVK